MYPSLVAKSNRNSTIDEFLQLCHNKPFWNWGQKHHLTWKYCEQCNQKYPENTSYCKHCNSKWEENKQDNLDKNIFPKRTLRFNDDLILDKADCCFTHIIGLPIKDFRIEIEPNNIFRERTTLPIFDWQRPLFDLFEKEQDNCIIKASGIGGSALKLRHMAYRISSYYDYENTQIPIIVGPEKGLAQTMIRRFKDLFPFLLYDNKDTCDFNNTELHVFASRNIAGIRSLENPRELFADEFDYFPFNERRNVMDTISRYLAKSGMKINAMSTPNEPFGYCYTLEFEPSDFHIYKMPYSLGLGSIYSLEQITIQKRKYGFEREYNLKYGGVTGNYFDPIDIEATTDEYKLIPLKEATTVMGIDSGWSSSYFAIVIMSFVRGKIYVMHCERHKNPFPQFMIDRIAELKRDFFVYKILSDGADPSFIYQLKERFRDTPPMTDKMINPDNPYDYHNVPPEQYLDMKIIPTSFTKKVMFYLNQDKTLLRNENRIIRIHKIFQELKNALYEVYVNLGKYEKSKSTLNDYVDAFSECVEFFTIKNIIQI